MQHVRPSTASQRPRLPDELWLHILSVTPIESHQAVRLASPQLRAFSEHQALWLPVINAALTYPKRVHQPQGFRASLALRQASRVLEVLPPAPNNTRYLAAPQARAQAVSYIASSLSASHPQQHQALERYVRGALPHLSQTDLRLVWQHTFTNIVNAASDRFGFNRTWATEPSPLLTRALYLEACGTEGPAWFCAVTEALPWAPPERVGQARHMAARALDHVLAVTPDALMPKLLEAAIALRRIEPASEAFESDYIRLCVTRLHAGHLPHFADRVQSLWAAGDKASIQAALELACALWRRAPAPLDSSLRRALWQLVLHPDAESRRLERRILPVLARHMPPHELPGVWRVCLNFCIAGPELFGAQPRLFDILAQRDGALCDAALFDRVVHQALAGGAAKRKTALVAAAALARHVLTPTQRQKMFAALLSGMQHDSATPSVAMFGPALVDVLVVLAQSPEPHAAWCETLYRALWARAQHASGDIEVCTNAMRRLAPDIGLGCHEALFDTLCTRLRLSIAAQDVAAIGQGLCGMACMLPHLSDMRHQEALVVLHGILTLCDVEAGALAADVLTQVRHGESGRRKSVQCIRARAAKTLQTMHLTMQQTAALDTLKRCELSMTRGHHRPERRRTTQAMVFDAAPVPVAQTLWVHEQRTCADLFDSLDAARMSDVLGA